MTFHKKVKYGAQKIMKEKNDSEVLVVRLVRKMK